MNAHTLFVCPFILLFLLAFSRQCGAAAPYRKHLISYGPSVASWGAAESVTASAHDASTLYYNPALLARLRLPEISLTHMFLYDGARYNAVFLSLPHKKKGTFAFGGTQFLRDNIEVRRTINESPETTQNNQTIAYFGYSDSIKSLKADYGLSLKYLFSTMHTRKDSGISLDLGAAKQLFSAKYTKKKMLTISSGLAVQNILQKPLRLDEYEEDLPLIVRFGLGYSLLFTPAFRKAGNEFLLETDIIYSDSLFEYAIGAQYKLFNYAVFRAGWKQGLTAGIGFTFSDFQIDYSLISREIANMNTIGFSHRFGDTAASQKAVLNKKKAPTDEYKKIYAQASRLYKNLYRRAATSLEKGDLIQAMSLLNKAQLLKAGDYSAAHQLSEICRQTLVKKDVMKYRAEADREALASDYLIRTVTAINTALEANDFFTADYECDKLACVGVPEQIDECRKRITTKRAALTGEFLNAGAMCINDNPEKAFRIFHHALALDPENALVRENIRKAQTKFDAEHSLTMEDKLYADLLYYSSVTRFIKGQDYLVTYQKLKNVYPVHDLLPGLENVLAQQVPAKKESHGR